MSKCHTTRFALLHKSCRKYGGRKWPQDLKPLPNTQDRYPSLHSPPLPPLIWCRFRKLPFLQPPTLLFPTLLTSGASSTCRPPHLQLLSFWWTSSAMPQTGNYPWYILQPICRAWGDNIFVLILWEFQTPACTLPPIFLVDPATILCCDCIRKYCRKIVFPSSSSAGSQFVKLCWEVKL